MGITNIPAAKVIDRKLRQNKRSVSDEQLAAYRELDADELHDLCARILSRRATEGEEMQLRLVGALAFHAPVAPVYR